MAEIEAVRRLRCQYPRWGKDKLAVLLSGGGIRVSVTCVGRILTDCCQELGIRLFELPPRSPKLNGCVERANRTHTEEFYDCADIPASVSQARALLLDWERTQNHVRPHQSLGYLTPAEFVANGPRDYRPTSPTCN